MFRCIGLGVLCLIIAASALLSESEPRPSGLQLSTGVRANAVRVQEDPNPTNERVAEGGELPRETQ
jgi:hypothetical protein